MKKLYCLFMVIISLLIITSCSKIDYHTIENPPYESKEVTGIINNVTYTLEIPNDFELEQFPNDVNNDSFLISSYERLDMNTPGRESCYFSISHPQTYDELYGMVIDDLFEGETEPFENFVNTNDQWLRGEDFAYQWYHGKYGNIIKVTYTLVDETDEQDYPDKAREYIIEYYCENTDCVLSFKTGGKIKENTPTALKYENVMLYIAGSFRKEK